MRRFILPLCIFGAAAALAQDGAVFHATTQLIRVDVAAQDKDGRAVADLTKDDFELRVNGKARAIDTFAVASAAPVVTEPLPRGTFSNRQEVAELAQGRYIVFLLDWRNTNRSLQIYANQQLQKMLESALPGGRIAIYLLKNGFQIVQEFTADRELLKEKAAGLAGATPPPLNTPEDAEEAARETVTAFRAIAKHLAGISGQKALIWVSTGFPDNAPPPPAAPGTAPIQITRANAAPNTNALADMDDAVRALGNANIVVESAESSYIGASVSGDMGPIVSYANTLQSIAERTGGRFFPADNNDLARTLTAAASDRAVSYEIGFYDDSAWLPGLVPMDIRTRRPGITLRHREGFYVEKNQPAKPPDTREEAMDVLERAVDAVKIPLTAKVTRTAGNKGDMTLRINVDAHALTLRHDANVWRTKPLVFVRFASDVEDQLGDAPLDSPELTLTEERHDRALRGGINLRFTMKMPPGAATMRVLVRDGDSGDTGTVTIPVADVPEGY